MSGRAVLVGTGGTIAWDDAEGRMLAAAELASRCGCVVDRAVDYSAVPSYDLTVRDMAEIARLVAEEVDAGASRVVVAAGTDTLEELAWTCELLATHVSLGRAGVVITGAMRFLDYPQADGEANLRAAFDLASSQGARDFGVRVALGGCVFGPRGLRKRDARAMQPFEGPTPRPRPVLPPVQGFDVDAGVVLRKVGAIPWDIVEERVTGLVLEGLGAAHLPTRALPVVDRLQASAIPVVLASRSRAWFRGARSDEWVLQAGDLTAEQAAISLMVALRQASGWDALREWWTALERGADA